MIKAIRTLITLVCLFSLGHQALAIDGPPPAGVPRDFSLPEKTSFQLDNGMGVTMVPFGDLPKISMVLRIRTGNLNEGEDTWLADMTGALMEEGTKSLDATALRQTAAALGGAIGISVGPEMTSVSVSSLAEKGVQALELLTDVVRNPAFPGDQLDRIRADFIRNLSISRVRPQGLASVAMNARLYGDHPFSVVFPTEEQLQSYTIEDLRRYYEGNFGARRSHLFVSGRFDTATMRQAIIESFGDWQAGPDVYVNVPDPTREGSLQVIDRPGAPQSTINVAIPVIGVADPDYSQLLMANDILGGAGFLSRLFQNLREDKGYTYGASTSTGNHYRSAVWTFSADVATEATGPSLTEFFREIRRLQSQAPADDEMERIRGYRGGIFVLANASRGGIIGTLAFMNFHDLPDSYLTEYTERLARISPEQVSEIAASQWPVGGMTIVVVGDRSVIDEQLTKVPEIASYLSD
ncbi:MAG: insulinase family protein [Gammaproteobacteria bacterium]|nr:MAG: insulinase family protein [Gammaproteobacteria bacterium]